MTNALDDYALMPLALSAIGRNPKSGSSLIVRAIALLGRVRQVPRILYLCPGLTQKAYGGKRRLYHHVDVLRGAGFDSFVVHARRGARLRWFDNETPILYAPIQVSTDDILVFPEVYGERLYTIAPGIPRVSLNLNVFNWTPPSADRHGSLVLSNVTNSEYGEGVLKRLLPGQRIAKIVHGIDRKLWVPELERKRFKISYMPRKHPLLSQQLTSVLASVASPDWEIFGIDNLPEGEVSTHLQQSELFLSFSKLEGFGRPPVEAMACGASVIGFSGVAGREYFDVTSAHEVPQGDILAFAEATADWLRLYKQAPEELHAQQMADAKRMHQMYSMAQERVDLIGEFSDLQGLLHPNAVGTAVLKPVDIEPAAALRRRVRVRANRLRHRQIL